MFRPILFFAIIRLDTINGENYTIYNTIQYNHQVTDGYTVSYYIFLAIVRLDTIIGENYTIYNTIQYNHQVIDGYTGVSAELQTRHLPNNRP